jgi:hypothetical protein
MKVLLDKQFVFIIGAARSGTTWLQAMIGAHPSVCTFGELQLYEFYTTPWVAAWKRQVEFSDFNGLPTLWSEDELYHFLREFLDRIYSQVLYTKPEATFILDKHPGNSFYIEHIDKLLPNVKFIHMIRDGRDVAVSALAASQSWGGLWAPKNIQSTASLWKASVLGAKHAQRYEGRYLEVKYEDFFANGVGTLKEVFEFIGAPVDFEEVVSIFHSHQFERMKQRGTGTNQYTLPETFFRKGQVGDWRSALTPTQRYIFHEVAGELLRELGYETDAWWLEHRYQRFTLPCFARLATRNGTSREIIRAVKYVLGPKWTERLRTMRDYLGGCPL